MKPTQRATSRVGLTLIEILVLVAILFILAVLVLPFPAGHRTKAGRIVCVSNLKQVGLAFRMWNETGPAFPFAVSVSNARPGSLEFVVPSQTWRHFQVISKELTSPKVLACPNDTRLRVQTWAEFVSNRHLSYFAGLDADETRPQTILSGDRNLATNGKSASDLLRLAAATGVEWTKEIHQNQGNLGLSDGSVQQTTISALRKQIEAAIASETNRAPIRLLIP